ncbi:mismatch repair ATPase MSH2 KNAG_0K00810 [Huiozyma naganishii CBS 8797]|uniref:DNA mismatch repair protein MSH2 n=1 Tax=Huiozyma naganishii (strain ATCC MYA-139 / BCRC 22969 / CBS 8797 / KCTC 17520 / NBRC 10181 / NCYC 3082 / Yp74L-3) TaxID=1071383 RepID=J7S367_HUIN7|nr:hypothetical protein KNAG_0K00810 [Kazachstania naganishii CBS 8797]CCK72447.1 hypothetical protein KNAG_0K00810 [Kazachstania naganishii CBS 8797]
MSTAASRPDLKFSGIAEERSFYSRFLTLEEKPTTTIRIVDRGEYYTVVSTDAVFVADSIYHTQSVLKTCNLDPVTAKKFGQQPKQYVTLSPQILSNLLKKCLLELGYKVEIYDKAWKLLRMASPGNIDSVADLLNVSIDNSIVIASLKLQFNPKDGNCLIGVAFVDTSDYKLGMLDILDNEVFSNLESFLIQLGVKECLVPDLSHAENNQEWTKIVNVIDRCGTAATLIRSSQFNKGNEDVENDLIKLTNDKLIMSLPQKFSPLALGACHALLDYLNLLSNSDVLGKFELVQHSLKEFIKLDASSIKALNLYPQGPSNPTMTSTQTSNFSYGFNSKGKVTSLFQLLNHCKTNAGIRLLNEWIKQPLTDMTKINTRHNLVEYLIDQLELRQLLQCDYLPLFPDLRRLTKRLIKNGTLEDVLKVYQFTKRVPELVQLLESFTNPDEENLADSENESSLEKLVQDTWIVPLQDRLDPLSKLEEMVETTIDLDAYEENNDFMIKVEFNQELGSIRDQLDNLREKIKQIHLEAAEDLGFDPEKKLKLENHHMHGWCMRLTRNDAKELRKHREYIELSTIKAGIFFSTKKLKEVASKTAELEKEYEKQQSILVKEIVSITLTYSPVLEKISLVLAHLDVLTSFAHVSSYAPIPYVRPTMHDFGSKRKTHLVASRHPVLEMQDDIVFIANDVDLEKDSKEFLIITGPNMGGKSTYIRQVGVITLMAQIGCFVPCEEAEIAVVDAILCRVGAGDSQLKGVSTFMVEMLETASILKNATENSLIIVDELGRGTSTYDGFGLAWAIAEHIAKKIKCFTLFATHFHELTSLADKLSNVVNMHVVAHIEQSEKSQHDSDDITLLYKVELGISDQSFGIHVAEVVQFPQKIVKMAKRKAAELEDLKQSNESLKKNKLSVSEINEGNQQLKKLLQSWVQSVKELGLDDPEKLSDDLRQKKAQELLKEITTGSPIKNPKYLEHIKSLLL